MNLQQLRYLVEVAKQGLNFSEAAEKLYTSQPGISKQIRLLEEELGIQIFIRNGKRITGLSEPGKHVLLIAERILQETRNLKKVGEEFTKESEGSLTIATTHTQARYALPNVIKAFLATYPKVRLSIKQGNPTQICEMVLSGEANFAIATEGIAHYSQLAMLPCYEWNRSLIVPNAHPLAALDRLVTLEDINRYPLITYDFAFADRSKINQTFAKANLIPNVVLTAIDADVIKTYVELGLGIGLIASMAFEPEKDQGLTSIDCSHLFEPSLTKIGILQGAYLRGFAYGFITLFAPHLTREKVDSTLLTLAV